MMTLRIINDPRAGSVELDGTTDVLHGHWGCQLDLAVFADVFRIVPFSIDILCDDLEVFLIAFSVLMGSNQDSTSFPQEGFDPRDLPCEPRKVILEDPMPLLHIVGIKALTRRVIHI